MRNNISQLTRRKSICLKCGAHIYFMNGSSGYWHIVNADDYETHICKPKCTTFTKEQINKLNKELLGSDYVRLQSSCNQSY